MFQVFHAHALQSTAHLSCSLEKSLAGGVEMHPFLTSRGGRVTGVATIGAVVSGAATSSGSTAGATGTTATGTAPFTPGETVTSLGSGPEYGGVFHAARRSQSNTSSIHIFLIR